LGGKGEKAATQTAQTAVGSKGAEAMRQYAVEDVSGEENVLLAAVEYGRGEAHLSPTGAGSKRDEVVESTLTGNCEHDVLPVEAGYIQDEDSPSSDSGDIKETWEETAAAVHGDKAGDKGKRLNPRVIELKIRATEEEYMQAVERCNKALADWRIALHRLDWVHEPDQIDYAIYSVIAAEKHYATTLKETKRLYRQLDDMRKQRFA
jgi:hypothetical protein